MQPAKFLTINSFKRALDREGPSGIGRDAIRDAVADGRIRSFKSGNRALIPESELTAWPQRELEVGK